MLEAFRVDHKNETKEGEVWIDARKFEDVLANDMMLSHFEQEIEDMLELLDVRGNKGKIDLNEFTELVGVVDYHSRADVNKKSHKYHLDKRHSPNYFV